MNSTVFPIRQVPVLLRGESAAVAPWTEAASPARVATWLAVTVLGSAAFGAAMGWWRAPEQAFYTAVKLPLVLLFTALGNALLNAMLAPLLGVNIGLRQSLLAVLMSFTIAGAILGGVAPLLAFVIWNAPPLERAASAGATHAFILLTIVAAIAFAGVAANVRLLQLLAHLGGGAGAARRVLFAWLVANLFFGSQLSWVLRPFIGSPGLPVQFLRDDPFKGSFYEAVFHSFTRLFLD
ncbi:MAG: hypothetical protein B9S33_00160 [Pedosphaera sp. Tous-C6FEB]|nr:MAG: hypothetical protein B9S33_00160 [Pedosphaera sp. Tous-C6FEB]